MKQARKTFSQIKRGHNRKRWGLLLLITIIILISAVILKQNNFPIRISFSDLTLKTPLSSRDYAGKLINLLSQAGIETESIKVYPDRTEVILKDGTISVFNAENLELKVSSLQFILKRFTIEGRKAKVIDLRYNKPVVK